MSEQRPIDVFGADELDDGDMRTIPATVSGWSDAITIFRDGDAFYALDDTCPHERSSLGEGWLEDGEIECPLHQSRFNLKTGAVTCLPATRNARTHLVRVVDGRVWLTPGQPQTDAA
jgi:nitrite reductase/ring-hydroxylating ferredoxin subunit